MLSRFSYVRLFAILSTLALQAPLSLGFARQGYWNGLPYPPPGDFPDPEIESRVLSLGQPFVTLWTVAHEALLPMECSRHEYWSVLSFPTSGDPSVPGSEPASLVSPALIGRFFITASPGKA